MGRGRDRRLGRNLELWTRATSAPVELANLSQGEASCRTLTSLARLCTSYYERGLPRLGHQRDPSKHPVKIAEYVHRRPTLEQSIALHRRRLGLLPLRAHRLKVYASEHRQRLPLLKLNPP